MLFILSINRTMPLTHAPLPFVWIDCFIRISCFVYAVPKIDTIFYIFQQNRNEKKRTKINHHLQLNFEYENKPIDWVKLNIVIVASIVTTSIQWKFSKKSSHSLAFDLFTFFHHARVWVTPVNATFVYKICNNEIEMKKIKRTLLNPMSHCRSICCFDLKKKKPKLQLKSNCYFMKFSLSEINRKKKNKSKWVKSFSIFR